jgi:hypothetical protein
MCGERSSPGQRATRVASIEADAAPILTQELDAEPVTAAVAAPCRANRDVDAMPTEHRIPGAEHLFLVVPLAGDEGAYCIARDFLLLPDAAARGDERHRHEPDA